MGAEYALNLNGGGTTTLWVKGVGVVNYPCETKISEHHGGPGGVENRPVNQM
ncbi:phosphodiester glycosidase family protein [Rikenellaceae bacterium]|uniref:phosphodiester glycosidase family protein n=1 Tax=Alistipes shahii TaxID=328814 RepID=UPI0011CAB28E